MVLKIFVLLFFLFYSVSIGNTNKINYIFNWRQDPCPFLWDRPNHTLLVPPSTFEYGNTILTGTRHHVIPFQVLRNFFSFAVQRSREASRIGEYLSAYISTITDQLIDRGQSVQRPEPIPTDAEAVIFIDPMEEMFASLTWLPGNIFLGPAPQNRRRDDPLNQRGGDPGNAFEQYANRIIRDEAHFTALENLNRDMQLYLNNPLNFDLFFQIMHNLDIVNRRTTPFPFDAQDWEKVNGKFVIRKPSERHRKKRYEDQIPLPPVEPDSEPSSDDDPFDYFVGFCRAVERQLPKSNIPLQNKYIKVNDKMEFGCPKNTYIIVKRATLQIMPWPVYTFSLGLACLTGECSKQDGTDTFKRFCDNKRSCVFSTNETKGLDVEIDYYCSHVLTPIKERKELEKKFRWSSNEFELNCPLNYNIRVDKAVRHKSLLFSCLIDDCNEKDITTILREYCNGENPCKNSIEDWGLQPITVDFSCIPNASILV
ncbi:uncharacterized protein LOC129906415 [Episyrphus balteatus]|uniref:uncharacterized protein LOC129906415 n=1 Tax=Episyrphus balteatus TaxID=286459 RepID=UPI0024853FF5|nr:uncharacterized protein LOC129906415 [Episyrphus balteatus]